MVTWDSRDGLDWGVPVVPNDEEAALCVIFSLNNFGHQQLERNNLG
jgi:hypothetical protein